MFNADQNPNPDEWISSKHRRLRAWYLCMNTCGGEYPPCGTVIPSNQWMRERVGSSRNVGISRWQWCCVSCGSRFRGKYGVLVEVQANGASMFMLTANPNAMSLEQIYDPKHWAELWNNIPDFVPVDPRAVLRPLQATVRQLIAV